MTLTLSPLRHDGALASVNTRLEPRLARAIQATRATHVHLAFYPRDTAAWRRRVAALRKRGITSSWDFGWNDVLAQDAGLQSLIDTLDIVFVNEREAALYAGAPDLEAALPYWKSRRPIVVIKLGADGCRAFWPGGACAAPAPKVTVVDTTGAGDAFNGGFLAAWLRGGTPRQCLAAGNAALAAERGNLESFKASSQTQLSGAEARISELSAEIEKYRSEKRGGQ